MSYDLQSWVGVPFRYRGCDRRGCDCAGLILGILKEAGEDLGDLASDYSNHKVSNSNYIDGQKIINALDKRFCRTSTERVTRGDIVLLRSGSGAVFHLGVISRTEPLYILHASGKMGRVVESIINDKIAQRIFVVYQTNLEQARP